MPNSSQPFQGLLPDFDFATGSCTALLLVGMTDLLSHGMHCWHVAASAGLRCTSNL